MNREYLGHNIGMLCKFHKISHTDLSNLISHSPYRINDIVANKPIRINSDEVEELAKYFKVPVDDLVNKKAHIEFK